MLVHILQLKYKCTEDVLRNSIILAICSPYGLQRNIYFSVRMNSNPSNQNMAEKQEVILM